jgi:hypothetical protein
MSDNKTNNNNYFIFIIVFILIILLILLVIFLSNNKNDVVHNDTHIISEEDLAIKVKVSNMIKPVSTNTIINAEIIPDEQTTIDFDKQNNITVNKTDTTVNKTDSTVNKTDTKTIQEIDEYGPEIILYTEQSQTIKKYYCRKQNKRTKKYIYYIRTEYNKKTSVDYVKPEELKIPNNKTIILEEKLRNNIIIPETTNIKLEPSKFDQPTLYGGFKENQYYDYQSLLITFYNLNSSAYFRETIKNTLGNNIDYQITAFTETTENATSYYDKFVIYGRPNDLINFKKEYEKINNSVGGVCIPSSTNSCDSLEIFPLVPELKISYNDINQQTYESIGLLTTVLYLRIGLFKSRDKDEEKIVNDYISEYVSEDKIFIENDFLLIYYFFKYR